MSSSSGSGVSSGVDVQQMQTQTQVTPFDGYGSDPAGDYAAQTRSPLGSNLALARPGYGGGNGSAALAPYDASMGGGGVPPQGAVFKKIHQGLRGRYVIAIILGLLLGVAGGYAGFKSQKALYRGEALIQIRHHIKDFNNSYIAGFDELLQSEALTVASRRMIREAMRRREWEATGLGMDSDTLNKVAEHLAAEHPARTEYIRVYFVHENDKVAESVVKAITKAYESFYLDRARTDEAKRYNAMSDRLGTLRSQLQRIDEKIYEISREFSGANLDAIHEMKFEQAQKIQNQLDMAEFALESAKSKQDAKEVLLNLSVEKIAIVNDVMRDHLKARNQIRTEIDDLLQRGVMAGHEKVKYLQARLEAKNREIEHFAAEWRDLVKMGADDPTILQGNIARMLAMTPRVLEREVNHLKKRHEELSKQMNAVGQKSLDLKQLLREKDEKTKEKADFERQHENFLINMRIENRLNIADYGTVPSKPFKDRRKMMSAAGAMFGFGLPLGVFVVMGLANRRYLYSDDAGESTQNVPLLGILPRLPDKLTDPEQAAVAAHCIHQIRIMLQVGADPESRRVFMVTSASTGDGKTSLTTALGLSFAASGSKTLVIDCDMVGQGLTHRLKAHGVPGLIETLELGTLRGHVRKTATKGLYVLPIGQADAVHAGVLSPLSMKRLLTACREHFDVIVIDTGPILGSLEASVVAPEADGVVLAVARGQQQPMVEKAIRMLRSIGGRVLGIVFNRAEQRDFARSVASASIRSLSARPCEPRAILPESDESSRFGPLARSVASCLPSSASAGAGSRPNGNGNGHANGNGSSAGSGSVSASGSVSGSAPTVEARG